MQIKTILAYTGGCDSRFKDIGRFISSLEYEMSVSCTYTSFWQGFDKEDDVQQIFEYVLGDIPFPKIVCSVFGSPQIPNDFKGVLVTYSGEPYNRDFVNAINLNMSSCANTRPNTVPVQLFSITAYRNNAWTHLQTRVIPTTVDLHTKFCAFVVGNGGVYIRNKFMQKLSQYRHVDSCGSYMNNIGKHAPGKNCGDPVYWNFLSQYKFNICFENTNQKNYITEKLFNAYMGGSIPIFWGTNQVLQWFNPKAFLYLEDESEEAMDKLIEKIRIIDNDDALFRDMVSQPLLLGDIPTDMNMDTWKSKINHIYLN